MTRDPGDLDTRPERNARPLMGVEGRQRAREIVTHQRRELANGVVDEFLTRGSLHGESLLSPGEHNMRAG
jgi:hypothetical protein